MEHPHFIDRTSHTRRLQIVDEQIHQIRLKSCRVLEGSSCEGSTTTPAPHTVSGPGPADSVTSIFHRALSVATLFVVFRTQRTRESARRPWHQ
jgi:hypothetical protein